ncbi:MAG TPA: 23S rRNA (adenine(2503)-C(2))-methyltransferase RlmN [Coriobacteriia bacterium]
MNPREDIHALDRIGLERALTDLAQPAWRVSQIVRWLYQRGADSFDEMTDLPADLRAELGERFALVAPRVVDRQVSADGTRKYLVRLGDGVQVETVGLPDGPRLTVCFSTQAGCAMGCAFCATGRGGLIRSLAPGEMVDQVTVVSRDFGERVTNAVAMGQGEPFAVYDAVLAALRFMNAEDGPGIGARHLTVSTCGLLPGIRAFASEPEQFTLAVSLHSAVQATRDRLMPGVRAYPLDRLRSELAAYASATGRRPTVEYALIGGANDTAAELEALVEWCSGVHCHVNLIPVNPVDGAGLSRPGRGAAERFRRALSKAGIEVSVRAERGADIDAACGQLRQRSNATPGSDPISPAP